MQNFPAWCYIVLVWAGYAFAASLPDSIVLVLPINNTVLASNTTIAQVGIDDTNYPVQTGYNRSVSMSIVYPNGTTVQLGGILGGCQTYQGVIYNFKFSCPIIGTYTAIANTTYQIGNCSTQQYTSTQTFIVQDAFQVSAENVSSSDGGGCFGPGCNDNGTLTTTTVRFDHEPTGTVSSSSSKQFVLLGAVVEPRMMLLVVAMLSMLVSC